MKAQYDRVARGYGKVIKVHKSEALVGQEIAVPIRMDVTGKFAAFYLSTWMTSMNLPDLIQQVDDAVAKGGPVSWGYYIELDEVEGMKTARYHHDGDERARVVLTFRLIKVSAEVKGMRKNSYGREVEDVYRLHIPAEVHPDGELVDASSRPTRYEPTHDETLVAYTPERWATLVRLSEAIEELSARLRLFLGEEDAATGFLDRAADLPQLLAALPEEPVAPRKRRA